MDIDILRKCTGASEKDAAKFADIIDDVLAAHEINTPERIAAFLSQVGHESGGLHYLREIWGPTKAQAGYEGRANLGNIYPGDGKKFMGRGLLQTTGRANYTKTGANLGLDLVNQPELLEQPINALESAAYYWTSHSLNEAADNEDVKLLTHRINGGYNGLVERERLYKEAREALA